MFKQILIYLTISLFLLGCTSKKKQEEVIVPKDILPQDSMVMVLTQVHLVEAAIFIKQQQGLNQDKRLVKQYYSHLFMTLDVDLIRFKESLKFYSFHPNEMEKIYSEVVNELSIIEGEVGN